MTTLIVGEQKTLAKAPKRVREFVGLHPEIFDRFELLTFEHQGADVHLAVGLSVGGDAVIGSIVLDSLGGYLGCQNCLAEIDGTDESVCRDCR